MPKGVQQQAFKAQIELVIAHELPLVIHLRGPVVEETRKILKETLVRTAFVSLGAKACN